ncbi:MAG: LLM class flavin-dependent oxidoreductase, partial [Acetobacteraceae bacterium]|nr:LLM class flavin-dependent oxidoreductase [Acetobacteraceae bacterium]
AMHLDVSTRGRKTDEALEIIKRLWAGEKLDFEGRHFRLSGAQIAPLPLQPDLPLWIGGSSDAAIRRTARYGTGWQAGPETPEDVRRVVAAIQQAVVAEGRSIDEDHYGAAFAYRFGTWADRGMERVAETYRVHTGRDAREAFAVGGAQDVLDRLTDYVEAGASKFILRPAAMGDEDMLAQTRRLIEEVLPVVTARWPRPAKAVA